MTRLEFHFTQCERSWLFVPHTYQIPTVFESIGLAKYLPQTVDIMPLQFHAMMYSLFGSLIGPFGGFFASGVKRALKVDVLYL